MDFFVALRGRVHPAKLRTVQQQQGMGARQMVGRLRNILAEGGEEYSDQGLHPGNRRREGTSIRGGRPRWRRKEAEKPTGGCRRESKLSMLRLDFEGLRRLRRRVSIPTLAGFGARYPRYTRHRPGQTQRRAAREAAGDSKHEVAAGVWETGPGRLTMARRAPGLERVSIQRRLALLQHLVQGRAQ